MDISSIAKIDKTEVLRYMGHKGQSIDDNLNMQIERNIDLCHKISSPRWTYGYFDIDFAPDSVCIKDSGIVLKGHDIYDHLFGARKCVIMAVTLGMELEKRLLQLERTSMTDALILDCAANVYAENVAEYVQSIITKELKDKHTNYRYSPGYGDFAIETQNSLIPLLQCEKRIGLTVTPSSIMIPRKSITAVMGVFDKEQISKKKGCKGCNLYHTCTIRKDDGAPCARSTAN